MTTEELTPDPSIKATEGFLEDMGLAPEPKTVYVGQTPVSTPTQGKTPSEIIEVSEDYKCPSISSSIEPGADNSGVMSVKQAEDWQQFIDGKIEYRSPFPPAQPQAAHSPS